MHRRCGTRGRRDASACTRRSLLQLAASAMRPHVFDNPRAPYLVLRPKPQQASDTGAGAVDAGGRWRMPLPVDAEEMLASDLRQCIRHGEALAFAPSVPVQLISQPPKDTTAPPDPK